MKERRASCDWGNPEVYKRLVLWIIMCASLAVNYGLYQDNHYMDEQFRLIKAGLVEDALNTYDWECGNK